MTLDHRARSADIALHIYTDADHRAAEALLSDVMPDDTRVYLPTAVDLYPALDLDNARPRPDPEGRAPSGFAVFMLALIAFLASVAIAAILGVRWWP